MPPSSRPDRNLGMTRPFLLYCPTFHNDLACEAFSPERLFDVALHDFSGDVYSGDLRAEFRFCGKMHKWPAISVHISQLLREYEYFAFLDNDIEITTRELNHLFLLGRQHELDLYQASLTDDSYGTYPELFRKPCIDAGVRSLRFVEIMAPIFGRDALKRCLWTFSESESGWGLDFLWAKELHGRRIAVLDAVSMKHARPISSHNWTFASGLTPEKEAAAIVRKYALESFVPPLGRSRRSRLQEIVRLSRLRGIVRSALTEPSDRKTRLPTFLNLHSL